MSDIGKFKKMVLQKGLKEFLKLLGCHEVQYVVVGGFALAYHGHPRFTGDIDFFVGHTSENALLLMKVMGVSPNRIDILTSLTGVSFEEAGQSRLADQLDTIAVFYTEKSLLKRNKQKLGRKQDLADLDKL